MNKLSSRSIKTIIIFSSLVFIVLTATAFLTVMITIFLYHIGFYNAHNRITILFVSVFISIIVGTILSRFVGKRPIGIIEGISKATQEIAHGNFDVQIDENIPAVEIREMAHNFNLMAKELTGTELLRNDFIENVSHEFKTPLAAIDGYVTLLQKKGLTEEKRQEYTERILFNTKRLSALTGNILLLSRLENQEIAIKKEKFSLDEQLRETVLMYETQWNSRNIELDVDLDTVDYIGNRELLAQVWQNLFGNAMKFVPDNGTIRILLRKKATGAVISVVDNGIGMSKEITERVYEKFYQGDSSRASSGNGLGLTLAKRIVNLHEGTISVSSKEGKGTTFTVYIP